MLRRNFDAYDEDAFGLAFDVAWFVVVFLLGE
jgi:hypothetical protein